MEAKLNPQQIYNLIQKHKKTIQQGFEYDLSNSKEYYAHRDLIKEIGNNYMGREFRAFEVDEYNSKILSFLLYYFNGCKLAESVFPNEEYQVHKSLLFVGHPGTGKTMLMLIFADYLRLTCNPNSFENLSVTQMMNYYKIHGHIDLYTYNEAQIKGFKPNPFNICLNDIGLETENQKSYGTSLDSVIDEFLYARYEIYQAYFKNYHITSNLSVEDFKTRFGSRLVDRFKSFNVISIRGESRRK
ncbi:MAG: ATP-binding protein [Bacteroides xylanisolvens]